MSEYQINYKIWLEKEGKVFGEGPANILSLVEKKGSLNQAAEAMGMSYSQAWHLIKQLEDRLGFKLLNAYSGGKNGGGSELTPDARELQQQYHDFKEEADVMLMQLAENFF
ncbi:MAG: winged helix-turn-helix domain-containing protein [Bacillota bacterium]